MNTNIFYKTSVINDPLGPTHSLASSEHCFRFVLLDFQKVGTDGRHVQKQLSLVAVTVGRPSGSKIRLFIFLMADLKYFTSSCASAHAFIHITQSMDDQARYILKIQRTQVNHMIQVHRNLQFKLMRCLQIFTLPSCCYFPNKLQKSYVN